MSQKHVLCYTVNRMVSNNQCIFFRTSALRCDIYDGGIWRCDTVCANEYSELDSTLLMKYLFCYFQACVL